MAKGKRQINLGNGAISTADTPSLTAEQAEQALAPQTPNTESNTMAEQHNIETNTEMPDHIPAVSTPAPETPDNGNDVDEDLLINQRSSAKDKKDYYMKEARKAGRDFANGMASQITLAEKILEGAVNGSLTYAEYPNDTKQDDALDMYKAFRMPKKDSPAIDITSGAFNNNVAKYRAMIYLGMNHRDNAQEWFGSVVDIYNEKSVLPDVRKSLKNFNGTFEAVADVVREQLARDTKAAPNVADLMDEDEIFDAMRKKEATSDDDAVTQLIDAWKSLNLAYNGKATKSGKGNFPGITNPKLASIIEELQDFAKKELDPKGSASFSAGTTKQKRSRRVIKAPTNGGQAQAPVTTGHSETDEWLADEPTVTLTEEEQEAQAQANNE